MSVALAKTAERPERPTLSAEKGRELLGLVLLALALFTAISFGSFDPRDPSVLHRTVSSEVRARNLIGPVGAHAAAVAFGFFGISCFALPCLLLVSGVRRLRKRVAERVVGRGVGTGLLLVALPGLLDLTLGNVAWPRGGLVQAGGAFGHLLTAFLDSRLSFAGSSILLGFAVVIGAALAVQSTLGDLLASWREKLARRMEERSLARERKRERRGKERARQRVVTKHLQRVVEERKQAADQQKSREPAVRRPAVASMPIPSAAVASASAPPANPSAPDHRLDLPLRPLRVTERSGEQAFSFRRVRPDSPPAFEEDEPEVRTPVAASPPPARVAAPGPVFRPAPAAVMTPSPAMPLRRVASTTPAVPQPSLPFPVEAPTSELPPVNLLQIEDHRTQIDETELIRLGEAIRTRCAEFGVDGTIEGISPGPVITIFELQPAPGVKVSQVVNLQDDLALAMKAESVRIDRMAGRSTLGIEIPNRDRRVIRLGTLLADERFRKSPSVLTMALGTDIYGEPYYADLATMPHLLVAGATGSGKSVGLQSMITSIVYKARRDEVQFIFIDPKRIELGVYADIPHLKTEVVVDPKKAANALRWAVAEMERRYRLLAEVHVRSIAFYNRALADPEVRERLALSDDGGDAFSAGDLKPLPYYVVIIDELADLMMVASSDVETSIARLAQMARAVGIHLIVATQRPSVDVLTGTIKANFPCRIAYATPSRHDSRTILDQVGSEKLLGKGDMLFMPPGSSRIVRLHGAYVSEQETAGLIRWLKKQGKPDLDPDVLRDRESSSGGGGEGMDDDGDDSLYEEAARLVVRERQASASFLQRRMRVGFSRAGRLIDMMERDGLLGSSQGSKAREILVPPNYFEEIDAVLGEEV
ncbi:MAG TPA: DNA translocase FtsK 4TM domain-containing protein [Thermoanaerobaculia bacterium]|nr:DNA translocase FtsK 4TM domain-containing protein [Thermoanaerobaculia bacterium]